MTNTSFRNALLLATALGAVLRSAPARADDSDARLNALEKQIQALQGELHHLKHDMAVHAQEVQAIQAQAAQRQQGKLARSVLQTTPEIPPGYALVPAAPGSTPDSVILAHIQEPEEPKLPLGTFRIGKVEVTLGGFLDASGIFRARNEVADIGSNFNTGIPLPNSPNYHETENHLTARASRFSATVKAKPDANTTLLGYAEMDFQGAAPTANSVQSNSYTPRLRQAYAVYDRSDLGFYVMGGQAWSLLTMDRKGIPYLTSGLNIPPTIDSAYIPGFTWTRQPQIRAVKTFDGGLFSLAASLENPQTNYYTGPNGLAPSTLGTITINSPGGSGYASTNNYSSDVAPDVIVKAAFDPSFAHFEAYGIARFERDRVSTTGKGDTNTTTGGGGGAAVLVHLIPNIVDLQGSFLAGDGIGRYGAAQLPDAVVGADGQPVALPEVQALLGIVAHPDPLIDLYGFAGTEQEKKASFAEEVKGKLTGYGYGSPLYSNDTCETELGASSGCVANTSGVIQGTVGGWYKFVHGEYGTMQVGAQYSYTKREVFQGIGPTPKTDENVVMLSFRYYPFQ